MASKDGDVSGVEFKAKSTKVMHNDPHYPPTAFTHDQWVELRDWLWNTGRPHRSGGDGRMFLYRFALGMNQIQERYGDSLLVVAGTGRLSVERAARYLKPSNVTWNQRTKIDDMIKVLNQKYSPDSLVRTLTKPIPQRQSSSNVDDDRCVMHRLRKFGNRADHDGGRDIRAEEKKTIVTLVYRLGFVLKAAEEQRQSDTTREEIKRAEALRDRAIDAGDVAAARAAKKEIDALTQRLADPFGHGRRRATDSVDAFKEWAATAQRCFGTGIDSWLQGLKDLRTRLASIDSAISQARDLESKYAQDEDFDQAAKQNQIVTDRSRDRTLQEISIVKHLDGLIGCVARVLTRSEPKLERLEKDLAAKVKMKDYRSAAMIKEKKEAIEQCVNQVKPLAAKFMSKRDVILTVATLSLLKTRVGLRAGECKAVKFTATELKTANFTAAELKAAKFTLTELTDAKFTAIECLLAPGVSRSDLKRMGFNVNAMKKHDKALYDNWSNPTEVERLVKLGANGSGYKHPIGGKTAKEWAQKKGHSQCVALFTKYGY
eukprot:g524.t1